jgi:Zn-dependent peptidase ImmA (M78 family)
MAQLFESEFHKGVMVAVVDSLDYQYQVLSPLFSEYGYGFVAPDQKLIFIDGNQHKSIYKIVEAHEVSHIIMNHTGIKGPNDEAEADSLAMVLLRKYGYYEEANILIREFKKRHGYSYNHINNKQNKLKAHSYANI